MGLPNDKGDMQECTALEAEETAGVGGDRDAVIVVICITWT